MHTRVLAERRLVADEYGVVMLRRILGEVEGRFGWRCRRFAASAEGYILDVETPSPTLSTGMRALNGGFARYVNDRHLASGHVFAARVESEVIAWPAN